MRPPAFSFKQLRPSYRFILIAHQHGSSTLVIRFWDARFPITADHRFVRVLSFLIGQRKPDRHAWLGGGSYKTSLLLCSNQIFSSLAHPNSESTFHSGQRSLCLLVALRRSGCRCRIRVCRLSMGLSCPRVFPNPS